jgi:hypothetical protein
MATQYAARAAARAGRAVCHGTAAGGAAAAVVWLAATSAAEGSAGGVPAAAAPARTRARAGDAALLTAPIWLACGSDAEEGGEGGEGGGGTSAARSVGGRSAARGGSAVAFSSASPAPGEGDILLRAGAASLIAEHRTKQRFRLVRTPHPHAPEVAAAPPPPPASSPGALADPPAALAGAASPQYLLGANVRCMLGWCRLAMARAYAFALYTDAAGLAHGGGLAGLLAAKEAAAASGGSAGTGAEVALVMKMARDISGEHMAHGFRNSVLARLSQRERAERAAAAAAAAAAPAAAASATTAVAAGPAGGTFVVESFPSPDRTKALATGKASAGVPAALALPGVSLHAASTDRGGPNALGLPSGGVAVAPAGSRAPSAADALQQLTAFAAAFNGWHFVAGDEVALVWRADGSVRLAINDAVLPAATVTHPAVARALFDVYCGKDAVSGRARDTFTANYDAAVARGIAAPRAAAALGAHATPTSSVLTPGPFQGMLMKAKKALGPAGAAAAGSGSGSGSGGREGGGGRLVAALDVDVAALADIVLAEHAGRTK